MHDLALAPLFTTREPNQPITLYSGPLTITKESLEFSGDGDVRLTWFPYVRVLFECAYEQKGTPTLTPLEDVIVRLEDLNTDCPGYVTDHTQSLMGRSDGHLGGYFPAAVSIGVPHSLRRVVFHLTNFRPFLGQPITDSDHGMWAGRLELRADGWLIRIDSVAPVHKIQKALREAGGYAITHVGSVEREDGSLFGSDDVRTELECLMFFCSLAAGRFCQPILLAGFDEANEKIWQEWSVWRTAPWSAALSALSTHRPRDLAQLYEGVATRWRDPDWRRATRYAVSWYVRANDETSSEARIVMAQVALELLAWIQLVEEGSTSPSKFDSMNAADKLRKLLSSLSAPLAIPTRFSTVTTAAAREGWGDSCEAFTRARNATTHVSKRSRLRLTYEEALPELSELGLWFVDLVILHFFKYQGQYVSRADSDSRQRMFLGSEASLRKPGCGTGA